MIWLFRQCNSCTIARAKLLAIASVFLFCAIDFLFFLFAFLIKYNTLSEHRVVGLYYIQIQHCLWHSVVPVEKRNCKYVNGEKEGERGKETIVLGFLSRP